MATITTILETRKTLSDGTHPVKLVVTHLGQRKYYTLKITDSGLTTDDWKQIQDPKTRKQFKDWRNTINSIEVRAREIIKELPEFSFIAFDRIYLNKFDDNDFYATLEALSNEFTEAGNIKTGIVYRTALNSFKSFKKSQRLPFTSVTVDFLKKYTAWMLNQGKSPTTVSMYTRCGRAAFNHVKITGDAYPFGRGKYQPPTARNTKKALTIADVGKIFRYDALPGSTRERMRDLWMFSYLSNGMNPKDICFLKYSDFHGDYFAFTRSKTAHKVAKKISVPITLEIAQILDKWKQPKVSPDTYVFPILSNDMNPKRQQMTIDNFVRLMNDHMEVIRQNIGIEGKITSYVARHSFASVLKRSGASTEFISESLGHSSMRTTENYLADFELEAKREQAKSLTNWG